LSIPAKPLPLLYALSWPWWYWQGKKLNPDPKTWATSDYRESYDLELGFLGDLMGLGDKDLAIHPQVSLFFRGCQSVVFNLEGLVENKSRPVLWNQTTRHWRVLESVREAFLDHHLIAGLANNHIDDVAHHDLQKNLAMLNQLDITAFGTKENPTIYLKDDLQLHAITAWMGKNPTAAATFQDLKLDQGQHLLFVHQGHEFHETPKVETINAVHALPENLIAVIGHHTHFPQAVEMQKRFVAWSLGNLAVKYGGRPVNWGLALRLGLKYLNGQWQVRGFKYQFIRNTPERDRVVVELSPLTKP
jgi:poly-gamma-glutamate capsule biosynthesis protein CapA/YwtB (metallophosphatase superfamily)